MTYQDPLAPKLSVEAHGENFRATSSTSEAPNTAAVSDIMNMLKVDSPSGKDMTHLGAIDEYLKANAKEGSQLDRLVTLRGIENRLGVPRIGETRLGKLYSYVKMTNQIQSIESARDTLLS